MTENDRLNAINYPLDNFKNNHCSPNRTIEKQNTFPCCLMQIKGRFIFNEEFKKCDTSIFRSDCIVVVAAHDNRMHSALFSTVLGLIYCFHKNNSSRRGNQSVVRNDNTPPATERTLHFFKIMIWERMSCFDVIGHRTRCYL